MLPTTAFDFPAEQAVQLSSPDPVYPGTQIQSVILPLPGEDTVLLGQDRHTLLSFAEYVFAGHCAHQSAVQSATKPSPCVAELEVNTTCKYPVVDLYTLFGFKEFLSWAIFFTSLQETSVHRLMVITSTSFSKAKDEKDIRISARLSSAAMSHVQCELLGYSEGPSEIEPVRRPFDELHSQPPEHVTLANAMVRAVKLACVPGKHFSHAALPVIGLNFP